MTKILVTTTSFQDTPGEHHALLDSQGYDITRERGPLPEDRMLELVGDFEGILCGDDAFTRKVLEKCRPKLKVLSKYGIGVDKIDLQAATDYRIPVTYCPGVNHTTVAEHRLRPDALALPSDYSAERHGSSRSVETDDRP